MPLLEKLQALETTTGENISIEELKALSQEVEFSFIQSELHQIIDSIDRGVVRTTDIIKNLKNFSRKPSEQFAYADLHAGLQFTLTILKHEIKEHEVEIQTDFGRIPLIYCDIGLLN